ncbi:hypothetical protein [Microbulbifer sp. PSTR4-B]|uniref:hypothetical protein n=1 Tax=Microbulbifer sp. PSTR4-B TaxID=3243396 RepID=UPI0040398CBF
MTLQDALREIADKAGYTTAIGAGAFAGWLANNWLGFAGVLIAAAGLMVNWGVSVKLDTSKFDQASAELKKQLPYASSVALNTVAFRIRGEEGAAMGHVFTNPAKLTLNSKKATKHSGIAKVFIRDQVSDGTAPGNTWPRRSWM